jgi:U6 snRNA-associated Sm-like protein LSm2
MGRETKEPRRAPASLATFIQALEGMKLVVELRKDTVVRGTLLAADDDMNLQLADATVQPLQGTARRAEYVYLRGSSVRFVHLPGSLEPSAAVEASRRRATEARRAAAREAGSTGNRRLPKGEDAAEGEDMES